MDMRFPSNSIVYAQFIFWFFAISGLIGCADTNTALFFTNTSLGIDFDSKPPAGSIGYNRTEGYIGPRYAEGVVPPVIAALESDNSLLRGNIRQVYATGKAATLVARRETDPTKITNDQPLKSTGELMFFGTTTSVGLKVGFSAQSVPDSFHFGYKRKEVSVLPIAVKKDGGEELHYYPSVIASIDTTGAANSSPNETGLSIMQFFGTGEAAEHLALNENIQSAFEDRAIDSIAKYRDAVARQNKISTGLLTCYQAVRFADLPEVWKDALRLKLLDSPSDLENLTELHENAQGAQESGDLAGREQNLRVANLTYASLVGGDRGAQPVRASLMAAHRNLVCDLANEGFPTN